MDNSIAAFFIHFERELRSNDREQVTQDHVTLAECRKVQARLMREAKARKDAVRKMKLMSAVNAAAGATPLVDSAKFATQFERKSELLSMKWRPASEQSERIIKAILEKRQIKKGHS